MRTRIYLLPLSVVEVGKNPTGCDFANSGETREGSGHSRGRLATFASSAPIFEDSRHNSLARRMSESIWITSGEDIPAERHAIGTPK